MTDGAPTLPAQADVVIIGGGIAGCAAAYYLAKRKLKVVLLERGTVAGEQSSRAWGFIRKQGRHSAEVPMAVEASRLWEALSDELGADLEFVRKGILGPASSELDEERAHESARISAEHGLSTRLLSAREMKSVLPEMQGNWRVGVYTADDAYGEPVKAARHHGVPPDAVRRTGFSAGAPCLLEDRSRRGLLEERKTMTLRRHRSGHDAAGGFGADQAGDDGRDRGRGIHPRGGLNRPGHTRRADVPAATSEQIASTWGLIWTRQESAGCAARTPLFASIRPGCRCTRAGGRCCGG